MEEKDTIEIGLIKNIICRDFRKIVTIVLGITLFTILLSLVLPKTYESSVVIRAKGQKTGSGLAMQAAAAAILLGGTNSNSTQTYIEMLKSKTVLNPVIAQMNLPQEDKEKLDNEIFAKKYLEIENKKGTDLIFLTATGRSPEEAQMIAGKTTEFFQQLLTKLNQSEQSMMMKFLGERIMLAKKEMEQAEIDLESYRQKEKIYAPEEQAKGIIQKLFELDQKNAQFSVENESNMVKLQAVNEQLRKQNAALMEYNLSDNQEIRTIRDAIITKQITLVSLQQRYTDQHPQVIMIRTEIAELQTKLKETIGQAVIAGTIALNPIHAALLQEKIEAETQLQVGQASLAALSKVQTKAESEISRLSAGGMTYLGLQRQVIMTQEVYKVLVQNYEQARVQEAMESMDIQIVDEADLPNKPSGPRKLIFAVVGLITGCLAAVGYTSFMCTKEISSQSARRIVHQ